MKLLTRAYACAPLLLIVGTLGWAGNTVAGKLSAAEMSPMMLIFLRWGLVTIVLGIITRRHIKQSLAIAQRHLPWLLAMGASISLFNGLFYWAANYTTAINLGLFQSTIPAFIVIGAYLYFKDRITTLQIVGLLVTLMGAALVVSQGDWRILRALTFNPGDIIMLIACLFYANYALGLRNRPAMGAFIMMWYIAAASWVATIPLVLIEGWLGYTRFPGAEGWLLLAYIALIPSLLSQVFFMRGVDLIGPSRAGLYTNLVPVYAAILGIIFLGEQPFYYHIMALLLVFSGIYLFEKSKRKQP